MPFPYGRFLYGRALYSAGMQQGNIADQATASGTRSGRVRYVDAAAHVATSDGTRQGVLSLYGAHAGVAQATHQSGAFVNHTGRVTALTISANLHLGELVSDGIVRDYALSCGRRFGSALLRAALHDVAVSADSIMGRIMWEPESPLPEDWEPHPPNPADIWTPHPPQGGPWTPQVH